MATSYELIKSLSSLNENLTRIADSLERIEKHIVKTPTQHPSTLQSSLDEFIHSKLKRGAQHEQ